MKWSRLFQYKHDVGKDVTLLAYNATLCVSHRNYIHTEFFGNCIYLLFVPGGLMVCPFRFLRTIHVYAHPLGVFIKLGTEVLKVRSFNGKRSAGFQPREPLAQNKK